MPKHKVGTQEEWSAAREELLGREQELGDLDEELAKQRQELPWVPVEKEYIFDGEEGGKDARRVVRRADAAPHLPPDVRSDVCGGVSGLLGPGRSLRPGSRPLEQPRCDVDLHLARAHREAAGLQAAHGLGVPLGVVDEY
jgi:hypothetical protein